MFVCSLGEGMSLDQVRGAHVRGFHKCKTCECFKMRIKLVAQGFFCLNFMNKECHFTVCFSVLCHVVRPKLSSMFYEVCSLFYFFLCSFSVCFLQGWCSSIWNGIICGGEITNIEVLKLGFPVPYKCWPIPFLVVCVCQLLECYMNGQMVKRQFNVKWLLEVIGWNSVWLVAWVQNIEWLQLY